MKKLRAVLIAGAGGGIGYSITRLLLKQGNIVIAIDNSEDRLDELKHKLSNWSNQLIVNCGDLSSEEFVKQVISQQNSVFQLDRIVYCVGVTGRGYIENTSLDDWNYIHCQNLNSAFLLIKHSTPWLKLLEAASIVLTASISANTAYAGGGCASYESSKAALVQLSRSAAMELAEWGVRVNCVSPGYVKTGFGDHRDILEDSVYSSNHTKFRPKNIKEIPLKKGCLPDDVAESIEFLLSNKSSYTTGTNLTMDGGYSVY
jgi:NAD(P)-dependent dehydrogenase (short-subunit alcohol dehydrogenase family)